MQAQEDSVSGRWHGPRCLGPADTPGGGQLSQLCLHSFSAWGRRPRGRVGATCVCLLSKCTRVCVEQGQKESPRPWDMSLSGSLSGLPHLSCGLGHL